MNKTTKLPMVRWFGVKVQVVAVPGAPYTSYEGESGRRGRGPRKGPGVTVIRSGVGEHLGTGKPCQAHRKDDAMSRNGIDTATDSVIIMD